MSNVRALYIAGLVFLLIALSSTVYAQSSVLQAAKPIKIAVASNLLSTMKKIVVAYEVASGRKVIVSGGSTGKHYSQIVHGAPFDLFFAADELRPRLLEEQGLGVKGSRFTYATGKLVIWSSAITPSHEMGVNISDDSIKRLFTDRTSRTVALANPKLAPYGRAANEVMERLFSSEKPPKPFNNLRWVKGENISQTYQFVASNTVDIGF